MKSPTVIGEALRTTTDIPMARSHTPDITEPVQATSDSKEERLASMPRSRGIGHNTATTQAASLKNRPKDCPF